MSSMVSAHDPALVRVTRGDALECLHHGCVVVTHPDGDRLALGDAGSPFLARSALKPVQAVAMVEAGLDVDGDLLALAAASHRGEAFHRTGVLRMLAPVGLGPEHLRTTAGLPIAPDALAEWLASGRREEPIAHNCSGKHAAMLRTCVRAGWPLDSYLQPDHPLQRAIRERLAEATGESVPDPVIDGCGAPAFVTSPRGLAQAFGAIASAQDGPARRVADAMRAHPEFVSGTGHDEVLLHREVTGLVAKMGAEGTLAAGLPDGTGIVVKISDGAHRGAITAMAATLAALGHATSASAEPILGHGAIVGATTVTPEFATALGRV